MKKQILHGLKILDHNDCDIRTLTILCNLNFFRGADKDVRKKVQEILEKLEKNGIVKKKKIKILINPDHPKKTFEVYLLMK